MVGPSSYSSATEPCHGAEWGWVNTSRTQTQGHHGLLATGDPKRLTSPIPPNGADGFCTLRSHMTKFVGTAAVEDLAGSVVIAMVNLALNDDPAECPYQSMTPPWYGNMWLETGDLMIEPLQTDARCVLSLDPPIENGGAGRVST